MTARFVNGAKFAISTVLATAVPVSAVTNAAPPVATTATVPALGDILIMKSGWSELNEVVARVIAPGAGVFSLEGYDATDLVRFPAGEGIGAYVKASSFVSLSQVREVTTDGGDQQYFNYQYVEDQGGRQRQAPTFKNALSTQIVLDYDPTLPWYAALISADRKRQPVVLREILPSGDVIYSYGNIAFNKIPTRVINENQTVTAAFSLLSDPIRYASP